VIVRVLPMGKDAAGLTRYLFGPGRANEHTDQRIIAGSPELAGEWAAGPLTASEATHLGRVVEAAWRRQYAPELALAGAGAGGIPRAGLHSHLTAELSASAVDGAVTGDPSAEQPHVFHATISRHPDDGPLTDERWSEIATLYMAGMGFTEVSGRPDAAWYAAHHGPSADGNDHIHITASTRRRDGTRVSVHDSGRRSQTIRRETLEHLPYVRPLHDASGTERSPARLRGYTQAEHARARARAAESGGVATTDRVLLQRILRAAATASRTEAAFINNVINSRRADGTGLEIAAARWRPGTGRTDVSGYKVRFDDMTATGPDGTPQPMWFSASTLAPDLTLPKLRPKWEAAETPESRVHAAALWAEETPGTARSASRDMPRELAEATRHLRDFNASLSRADPTDPDAWNSVTANAAAAAAAIAGAHPSGPRGAAHQPGLHAAGRAADALTRDWLAAGRGGHQQAPPHAPGGPRIRLAITHILIAAAATGTDRYTGWIAVISQLTRTIEAIARAREAQHRPVAAVTLRRDALQPMTGLGTWLHTQPGADAPALSPDAVAARATSGHATPQQPRSRGPAPATLPAREPARSAPSPRRPRSS
jgi:hypothetical protein